MTRKPSALRELTRQAVRTRIAEVGIALFVERGFQETTADDIAAAVGMSQRSVFRYFASKEQIALGKLDPVIEEMLDALRARPAGEAIWTSLRRVFDVMLAKAVGYEHLTEPIHRLILETPALRAGYLEKLQHMQDAVVALLLERAEAAGTPYEADDPAPLALTAAAFGCLVAAQQSWLAAGAQSPLGTAIDRAMATLDPT